MKYISTRGQSPSASFAEVLLAGLAPDGGLYLPEQWPSFSQQEITGLSGRPYAEIAAHLLQPFAGDDLPPAKLSEMTKAAYASFADPAVAPLRQIGEEDWLLELFHGPTLAFKDVALQLLGQLFDHVLGEKGERLTIIGATSGDTGGAAIEALAGLDAVDVFILHPEGRISDVQRRIMTSCEADNIHNIAVQGTFDDCQALVKAMFANKDFRERINMGAINSINWARIMAQAVYYFTAVNALALYGQPVNFTVPTGNFGDIFAGFVARKMGLETGKLVAATNRNDILHRAISEGDYSPAGVSATISPSMDIQVSSNFERLLFEASGRDAGLIRSLMEEMKAGDGFHVPMETLKEIKPLFLSGRASEKETTAAIASVHEETGNVIDPHTGVGVHVTRALRKAGKLSGPVVTLATAHPAKFPEAVKAACGIYPSLPPVLADLFSRPERFDVLGVGQSRIEAHILSLARAAA